MSELRFNKRNHYEFSNSYPVVIEYEGLTYQNTEAAFQAQKVTNNTARIPFQYMSASEAKRAGRLAKLRSDWEEEKYNIMKDILRKKFKRTIFRELLLETGEDIIIEDTTAWHDNIWGDCQCPKCMNKQGENLLGKILMELREEFRREQSE